VAFTDLDTTMCGTVWFGNDSMAQIKGSGSVLFICNNGEHRMFAGIYYILRLTANIVSVGQLDGTGYDIHIRQGIMDICEPSGRLLARVEQTNNRLYLLTVNVAQPVCVAAHGEESAWHSHARLSHINMPHCEECA
jgi:hypothetical protein